MPNRQPLHEAIRTAADPLAVLQRVVHQVLVLFPQADGASLEVRRDVNELEYLVAAGSLSSHVGLKLPVHGSFSGLTLISGKVQICADALDDPRVDAAAVASTGVRSMLCIPLSDQPASVAVLKVSSTHVAAFTETDAERLQVLARFLDVTVTAAADLAAVTAEVLTDLDRIDTTKQSGLDWQQATARFVASVMTPGLVDRVDLLSRVQDVLNQEAIQIVFQPVVDLRTGSMVSCEALCRFGAAGPEPPDWWFAAAHRSGLEVQLELLTLRKVLALMPQVPSHLHLAVNVGPETILRPEFLELVQTIDGTRLTVELTEHHAVENYGPIMAVRETLREMGIRLSVDDTGSGYSGLTHILQLQPDVIKLDRQMIVGIHADPVRKALAIALAAFAESIKAGVIAEGVELQDESDSLEQVGIHLIQGYLYWKPMPLSELIACAAKGIGGPGQLGGTC